MTNQTTINLPISAQGDWAAKRVYGDPKLAAAYLPVAYALLGSVKNRIALGEGVRYGHQVAQLPDGAVIRVIRNGEHNIVEITTPSYTQPEIEVFFEIFMETGYLDIRPMFPLYSGNKPAAKLYYGAKQLSKYNLSPSVFDWLADDEKKRAYSAGMNSLAVSSTWLPKDGGKPEDQRRPNPLGSSDKRFLLAPGTDGQHPNNRTGKLKLLLQARLGRKDVPKLDIINGLDSMASSVGLFTHQSGDYSLIVLSAAESGVTATIYPLLVNKSILDVKIGEGNDRIKETYLLSSAEIDHKSVYSISVTTKVIGKPFAYGWKFNYSGNKAAIVTSEVIYENDNPDGRILWHLQRVYQVFFSENSAKKKITHFTVAKSEEDKCTPRLQGDNLWYPKNYLGVPMLKYYYWETSPWPGPGRYVEPIACTGVPMYCWFDDSDGLQVVRFSMELHEGQPWTDSWKRLHTCGAGYNKSEDRYYAPYAIGEFYTSSINLDNTPLDIAGGLIEMEMTAFGYTGPPYVGVETVKCRYPIPFDVCSGSGSPPACPSVEGWIDNYFEFGIIPAMKNIVFRESTVNAFTGSLLIIPFGCAEAAYIGVGRVKTKASKVTTYRTGGDVLEIVNAGACSVYATGGYAGNFNYFNTNTTYGELDVRLGTQHHHSIAIEKDSYTHSVELSSAGSGMAISYSTEETGTAEEARRGFGDWNYLFTPILFGLDAFPYFRAMYTYESDAGDATYFDSDDFSFIYGTTESLFPPTEFFSMFVGWA